MKLGEKEFNERMKEEKEEDEKEETLKSKIRELRRIRNKERGGGQKGAPSRKRRKINPNNEDYILSPIVEGEIISNIKTLVTTTTKRKMDVTQELNNHEKEGRKLKQRRIGDYIAPRITSKLQQPDFANLAPLLASPGTSSLELHHPSRKLTQTKSPTYCSTNNVFH